MCCSSVDSAVHKRGFASDCPRPCFGHTHAPTADPCDTDLQLLVSGKWSQLEILELSCVELVVDAMRQLQKARWPQLRHLNVAGNALSARTIRQLSKGRWPRLEVLQVGLTRTFAESSLQCLNSSNCPLLRSLQLPNMIINSDAMARLAKSPWPHLEHLDLSGNSLTKDAVAYLAAGNWLHLASLELCGKEMDGASLKALTAGPWKFLHSLSLQSCDLSLASVPELLKKQWPKLDSLNLVQNRFRAPPPVHDWLLDWDTVAAVQTVTEFWGD